MRCRTYECLGTREEMLASFAFPQSHLQQCLAQTVFRPKCLLLLHVRRATFLWKYRNRRHLWFSLQRETLRERESKGFFHCAVQSCEFRKGNPELQESWVNVIYVDICPALNQEASLLNDNIAQLKQSNKGSVEIFETGDYFTNQTAVSAFSCISWPSSTIYLQEKKRKEKKTRWNMTRDAKLSYSVLPKESTLKRTLGASGHLEAPGVHSQPTNF